MVSVKRGAGIRSSLERKRETWNPAFGVRNLLLQTEELYILQNRLIAAEEMFRGTLSQTAVYPREVVKRALEFNAGGVIFAHNHPSGLAEPSHADEMLTQALKQALALVDVRVLDHFVVARMAAVSFAERGLV